MGKRATFTQAELARAVKIARLLDPTAVVEISGGAIRILPPGSQHVALPDADDEVGECDRHFGLE